MVQKLTLDEIDVAPEDAADVIYHLRRKLAEKDETFVYATSKNAIQEFHGPDPVVLLYLGSSMEDALAVVGDLREFEKPPIHFPNSFMHRYSAIPMQYIEWEMIRFWGTEGWWYSIVRFQLKEFDAAL